MPDNIHSNQAMVHPSRVHVFNGRIAALNSQFHCQEKAIGREYRLFPQVEFVHANGEREIIPLSFRKPFNQAINMCSLAQTEIHCIYSQGVYSVFHVSAYDGYEFSLPESQWGTLRAKTLRQIRKWRSLRYSSLGIALAGAFTPLTVVALPLGISLFVLQATVFKWKLKEHEAILEALPSREELAGNGVY